MDNISKCIYRCAAAGRAGIKGIKIRTLFTAEAYYPNAPQRERVRYSVCERERERETEDKTTDEEKQS